VLRIGPGSGELACGEVGSGRMAEPLEIVAAIERILTEDTRLAGRRALVTSGPTREPIDPVRYLSNHSSGKQGHAIAAALTAFGADTVLISGPTQERHPRPYRTARQRSAGAGYRLCRRDRGHCRQRPGQARSQALRLDSRQRRLARDRHIRRRPQYDPPGR